MSKNIEAIKHKTMSGVVSYALRTVLLYVITLVATGVLSVYLSPEEFGIYFVVTALIGLFTFLSDIGLAAALIQQKNEPSLSELRTTFSIQQVLAFLIFSLIFALTPVWKKYNGISNEGLYLLYALSFSFVLASLKTIPSILLERQLAFKKLVIPQIAEHIVFYVVAVTLAVKGYGVASYTWAVLLRGFMGVIVIYSLQRWQIGFSFSMKSFRKLLSFGVKFQLNDLLARLKDDLFIVVISKFLGTSSMGFIGWAKRWSFFPYQFSVNNVVAITFPTYSRLQKHTKLLARAVEKSIFFISMLIFPLLSGISAIAYPVLLLVPRLSKWEPALPSLYLFCINIAWAALSTPLTNTLNAIGEINKTLKLMVMWTVMTWILTPLFVWWIGFNGVALASAVIGFSSVVVVWMVKKVLPIRFTSQIWRQLLAAFVMLAVMWPLQGYMGRQLINLFIGSLIGVTSYAIILWMLGYTIIRQEILSLIKKS